MKNFILASIACVVLQFVFFSGGSLAGDIFLQVQQDFEWVNISKCKMPSAKEKPKPPVKVGGEGNKSPFEIYRRLLDPVGDGLCQVYDVLPIEKSAFTSKIYGHGVRKQRYEQGKWLEYGGDVGFWLPLVLMDKRSKGRIVIDIAYGDAGYSASSRWGASTCDDLRMIASVGYMLLYHPPEMLKKDPLYGGVWTDFQSGWLDLNYPGKEVIMYEHASDCLEKYEPVINLIEKWRKTRNVK